MPHPLRHSESLDEGQDAPESPELSLSGLGGDRFMAEERRRSSSYEDEIAKNWEYQCRNVLLDPDGQPYYYWLAVVALATMYNCGIIILRLAFSELRDGTCYQSWFSALDYLSDVIYFVDIGVHMRTGYLEDGILVLDPEKLKQNYMGRQNFKLAVLSLLPFGSFVGLLSGLASIFGLRFADKNLVHSPLLRIHRLLKYHMIPKFFEITDSRTSNPNVVRAFKLSLYLWVVIHWIGCFYYIVSEYEGFGTTGWVYPSDVDSQRFFRKYTLCIYWSMMTLTTIGERPPPETDIEYIFTGITFLIGVFVFAAVVGNVGDVISNMNAARQDYLARMDQIKFYMNHRNVPAFLQNRVKRWADYSWTRTQAIDEASLLDMLPERIRTEIAIHTNLDTLKKVQIFEECEEGLLQELVLKLRPQIYSPRDYICRIGEIGREMYIINHGRVEILVKNPSTGGKMVVATLTAGNYFGEISLLKLDAGQNRRTADVRSVGYSELLCLSRKDLICALVEYPDAKVILEEKARERMQMNKQARRSSSQGLSGQEDADQQTTNQNLSCDQAINKKSRLADVIRSNVFQNMVAKRGQEMTELKKVIEELKTFDSQATKIRVQQLSNKCEQLMAQLRSRDSELQQAIKRIAELEQVILGPAKRKWKALERQDKNNTHGQSDETDMETNGNGSPVGDNIDISQSVTASSKSYENGLGKSWTHRENGNTPRVNGQADHFRSDGPVHVDTSDTRTDCRKDSVVHRTPNALPVTNNNPSITDNRKSPCQNDRDLISDDNPEVEPALDLDTALLAVLSLGESEQLSDFSDSNSSSDADSDDIDL